MGFIEWASLILGGWLIFDGIQTIRRKKAHTPEEWSGLAARNLGLLWLVLGILFVAGVLFDIDWIKGFFKLFLESAN